MDDASNIPQTMHQPPVAAARSDAWSNRIIAAAVFIPAAAVLLVAYLLQPSAAGHGTHTQMGLPPCGFLTTTGLPCISCGMTTSFSHAAKGNLLAALATQPAGALLALLTAMTVVVSGYALVVGMPLSGLAQTVLRPRTLLILGAVLVVAWAYTISLALGIWP